MINLLDNVYDTTKADPVGVVLNGKNLLTNIQKEGMPAKINAAFEFGSVEKADCIVKTLLLTFVIVLVSTP